MQGNLVRSVGQGSGAAGVIQSLCLHCPSLRTAHIEARGLEGTVGKGRMGPRVVGKHGLACQSPASNPAQQTRGKAEADRQTDRQTACTGTTLLSWRTDRHRKQGNSLQGIQTGKETQPVTSRDSVISYTQKLRGSTENC